MEIKVNNKMVEIMKNLSHLRKYQQFFLLHHWALDYYVLNILKNTPTVLAKELSIMLMQSNSATSQHLKKLEQREFISVISGKDKRTRKISITDKGIKHLGLLDKLQIIDKI